MKFQVSTQATATTVQLQSVGHVHGKPAGELKEGDFTLWNFGYASEVMGIERETAAFIFVQLKGESGKVLTRKMKKTRLVAIAYK